MTSSVYLVRHDALREYPIMKVGVASSPRRIKDHTKRGWTVLGIYPVLDAQEARDIESEVLGCWMELNEAACDMAGETDDDSWWNLSCWDGANEEDMPQGGASETIQLHDYYLLPALKIVEQATPGDAAPSKHLMKRLNDCLAYHGETCPTFSTGHEVLAAIEVLDQQPWSGIGNLPWEPELPKVEAGYYTLETEEGSVLVWRVRHGERDGRNWVYITQVTHNERIVAQGAKGRTVLNAIASRLD